MSKGFLKSVLIAFAAGLAAATLTILVLVLQLSLEMRSMHETGVGMVAGGILPSLAAMFATFVAVLLTLQLTQNRSGSQ
jgi:hypothetical protein